MSQTTASINTRLIDSLAHLQRDIALGIDQLQNGEYIEYDDSSLLNLLETIKMRGKQRLQPE